jgi:pimeloyl-ACP methyl ester carboxylesterase
MTEHVASFPETTSLVGVLTDPEVDGGVRVPSVVFLNAGVLHRVGPNRLHVRLARELAHRGFASLRFDLSGVGDSPPRLDGLPVREAALSDVRDALDFLAARTAATSFVLVGLCSGADLAYRAALADARVVGAVLIDGLPYSTWRSRVHHHASRLRRRGALRRLFAVDGPVGRRLRNTSNEAVLAPAPRRRDVPPKEEAESGLRDLTARGVQLLLLYTQGREYSYRKQFGHMFPSVRKDRVEVAYFRDADHTFTLRSSQDLLVSAIATWVARFQ